MECILNKTQALMEEILKGREPLYTAWEKRRSKRDLETTIQDDGRDEEQKKGRRSQERPPHCQYRGHCATQGVFKTKVISEREKEGCQRRRGKGPRCRNYKFRHLILFQQSCDRTRLPSWGCFGKHKPPHRISKQTEQRWGRGMD